MTPNTASLDGYKRLIAFAVCCLGGLALIAPMGAPLAQRTGDEGTLLQARQTQVEEPRDGLETIVVTAARTRQRLADAPAAVTVLSADDIARNPGDDYGDLLRTVPGLNVSQTSVRDINMTARGATGTLANSQLVLLDGRSVYLDFFGIVMWDLLPVQADEIDRIEVVRGPGGAVWGANAMTGVVNVITKRPKDMPGTTVVVGTPYASVVSAAASGNFSYKLSAGYFSQPSYDRPTGVVPGSNPPQTYPDFENAGTQQRRVNLRFDWDIDEGYVSVAGGTATTDGILHSGIGPFDIHRDSSLSYLKADWYRADAHVGVSGAFLDGNADNLLTLASSGQPLSFLFSTDTYDLDASNTTSVGSRHILTYGSNYRSSAFDLDIAPAASSRNEWGAFLQDEISLADRLRLIIGARYDDVDPLKDGIVTPRTSLLIDLARDHVFRISYNEAFRTPSAINNYLDVGILQQLGPMFVGADAIGSGTLGEEQLTAYELGYVGEFNNGMSVTVSAYRNEIDDAVDFYVRDVYGPSNLPVASPTLPAAVIPCFLFSPGTGPITCPFGGLAGLVPSDYSYRNVGSTVNKGIEFSVEQDIADWTWFLNFSWQNEPEISGVESTDINVPPEWRLNAGVSRDVGKHFWSIVANYQDEAYWADVLYARAATDPFTQVNATLGWRFRNERFSLKLIAQNVFDQRVQQHIFGDILSRKVAAQISYTF